MKVRKLVLMAIQGSQDIKKLLLGALDVSQPTLSRFLRVNDDNLTKAASLKAIREGFLREGLEFTDDQILEEEPVNASTN